MRHIKWDLLSIVSCTVLPLSSRWNWRSVCMTPHYILQRERRRDEKLNEIQPAPPHKTLMFPWLFHAARDRKRESQYVSHLRDTLRSGLLACSRRRVSPRAPAWHVRHERAGVLLVCPFYPNPPLSAYYISLPLVPSAFQVYSWLSSRRSIFESAPLSFSRLLSLYLLLSWVDSVESWWIRLHVTVWHLSECDVVNMVPADRRCGNRSQWRRRSSTLAQLPSLTPLCLRRRSMCLHVHMCMCKKHFFPRGQRSAQYTAFLFLCPHVSSFL